MAEESPSPCWIEMKSFFDIGERIEAADFETAIHFSRYGKFQTLLLLICGSIYATCAISSTTLSFVLPSAKCDFDLTSEDKGHLSAMPLLGMIFGCSLWGSIADSHGRKVAIIASLLVDFLAAVISSFALSFPTFLMCRFFNGFGIIGATSLVFSYLGEFTSKNHRDVILGRLEVFWNVGVILLPGLAWNLLDVSPMDYWPDARDMSRWRFFTLVCSIPSLLSLVMLYFLPETPKFLISKGRHEEARRVFQKIFAFNTGRPECAYPVLSLEGEFDNNNTKIEENPDIPKKFLIKHKIQKKLSSVKDEFKLLFSQPYLKYLSITAFADFGLMASYYTLIMWFPEIFGRFGEYEHSHPNSTLPGVCTVLEATKNQTLSDENDVSILFDLPCNPAISSHVFVETIIIGISCIPTSVSLSLFMDKLGKKHVLICGLVLSGFSALSLNWVHGTSETLVLSCIFEALTSILEAVIFCIIVDLFPTRLRALALAVTATSGRLGAILGNIIFGMLIDMNCNIPIYLLGTLLIASGILCIAVPRSDNHIVIH